MQELCAELNQEDPIEIKAIMEVILTKLMHEVLSDGEKKNVRLSTRPIHLLADVPLSAPNGTSHLLYQSGLEPNVRRANERYRHSRIRHFGLHHIRIQEQGNEEPANDR